MQKLGHGGSERDTSYKNYDNEAYGSLDAAERISSLNKNDVNTISTQTSITNDSVMSDLSAESMKYQTKSEMTEPAVEAPFERSQLSQELQESLKRISGSNKVDAKPRRDVYSNLSQRSSNQKLQFEYLGLFPFDEVSSFLIKKEDSGNGTGNSIKCLEF